MGLKSVVLLSGGLDSTVNLFQAVNQGSVALALTFDYGQRAAKSEIQAARRLSAHLQVPHQVVELPFFKSWGQSSLLNTELKLPIREEVKIDDLKVSAQTAKSVWVPNRNGVFLNIAAGFAESLGAEIVVPGFNLEEAATFPDNSEAYAEALSKAFRFSTANQVQVKCWTMNLNKTQIVKLGIDLDVPFDLIWPCYFGQDRRCGQCESCLRFERALEANGVSF